MACVSRKLVLAALLAAPLAHAQEPPPLRYTIAPVLVHDALTALDITLETQAPPRDALLLRIGSTPHDLTANVSADASAPGYIKVKATPGAPITLHYRVTGNASLAGNREPGPYITADWSNAMCPVILALPDDWSPRPIDLQWRLPGGWRGVSSLPSGTPVSAGNLGNSACLVGRHLVDVIRPLGPTASLHAYTTDAAASARMIDTAAAALRPFADAAGKGAVDFPMYIGVVSTTGDVFSAWSNGTYMSVVQQRGVEGKELVGPIIQNYAGMVKPGMAEPSTAWYTSGMRSYLAISQLTSAGTMPRADVAVYLDQLSADYGNSPFRRASNAQIVADWQHAPLIQSIPLQRGLLFGWLLDARLRQATGGKACMADVLRGLAADVPDPAAALVAAVKAAGGGDITPLVEKYIVRGELLQLPPGALGPCMSVQTQADTFGWEVQHIADTCTVQPSVPPRAT